MTRLIFAFAVFLCVIPAGSAQTLPSDAPGVRQLERWGSPYSPKPAPPVRFQNSNRIDSLMRGGNLYLSLQDAIALTLENNLDIEFMRFGPATAETDVLRAKGGGTLRGLPLVLNEPPAGIGGPQSPLLTSTTPGFATGSVAVNVSDLAAITQTQTDLTIAAPSSAGSPVPAYDPALLTQLSLQQQSTPQPTTFITGTDLLSGSFFTGSTGLVQGFSTGAAISASFNATSQNTNSLHTALNPYTNSTLGLTITQPLLRGFGAAMNRRFIRIAKNNESASDLVFRQQALDTVWGAILLYYDLVSLNEDVRVKQQTLALAEKLYEDNKQQVEQGTLAPIELVRAQAQIAASRQDLANSDGYAREQELILKTVLTRRGTADPAVREAHIITTDTIPVPAVEPVQPIQDLVAAAFQKRPDWAQTQIQIDNSKISLEGSRNELRPELDLVGMFQNTGLAGQANPLAAALGFTTSPAYIGGLGTTLAQIFRRNYPTYGVGLTLNLPLRNRVAQADVARDEIQLRQSQVRQQQFQNLVRLQVEDALIAIQRSRAAYEAAVQTRILQEQSLAAEQEKFGVGLSTTFLIIQYESALAQARSTEVAARGAYAKARVTLEHAIGMTLENNGVSIDDVYRGRVSRPPSAIPATTAPSPPVAAPAKP